MSELITRNFRIWAERQTVKPYEKIIANIFGKDFLYGKTIDEIVYDAVSDPMPVRSDQLIGKMTEKYIVIYVHYNRYLQSRVWDKAIFVNRNIVCKAVLFHKKVKSTLDYRIRVWGFDYAEKLWRRWIENGFEIHNDNIYYVKQEFFRGLSLQPVEGFSYPKPVSIVSAIGVGVLLVIVTGLSVGIVWLILMLRNICKEYTLFLKSLL